MHVEYDSYSVFLYFTNFNKHVPFSYLIIYSLEKRKHYIKLQSMLTLQFQCKFMNWKGIQSTSSVYYFNVI